MWGKEGCAGAGAAPLLRLVGRESIVLGLEIDHKSQTLKGQPCMLAALQTQGSPGWKSDIFSPWKRC